MALVVAFARRRWLDFRNGHSVYLALMLQMSNFVLIGYTFLVGKVTDIGMPAFIGIFAATYIPAAVVLGHIHRRKQYSVDAEQNFKHNIVEAKLYLVLLRAIDGTATKEELDTSKKYLEDIVSGK